MDWKATALLLLDPLFSLLSTKLEISRFTIHYFFANATLQYNSSSMNYISEMER